jgi:hypothetical protein
VTRQVSIPSWHFRIPSDRVLAGVGPQDGSYQINWAGLTCLPKGHRVETTREQVRVALDGEIFRVRPPLRYRSRPLALRVRVPAGKG